MAHSIIMHYFNYKLKKTNEFDYITKVSTGGILIDTVYRFKSEEIHSLGIYIRKTTDKYFNPKYCQLVTTYRYHYSRKRSSYFREVSGSFDGDITNTDSLIKFRESLVEYDNEADEFIINHKKLHIFNKYFGKYLLLL